MAEINENVLLLIYINGFSLEFRLSTTYVSFYTNTLYRTAIAITQFSSVLCFPKRLMVIDVKRNRRKNIEQIVLCGM